MKYKTILWTALLCLAMGCKTAIRQTPANASKTKVEIENIMDRYILKAWYPRVVDTTFGGFLSNFDYKWQRKTQQEKMIVTQSRHLWSLSKAASLYPENNIYPVAAAHGFRFLKDKMWDAQYGGFFNLVDQAGRPTPPTDHIKQAYGNAFALFALAAYYQMSRDTAALHLAQRTFYWLERYSHDPEYGGYFQFLQQNGSPLKNGSGRTPPKDQNSSIHLLEAFTELYRVWPDDLVRRRLDEMLVLIRDTMTDPRGFLNLHFQADWTPLSYRDSTEAMRKKYVYLDNVSFGHDIETAWLLMDAATALGKPNDPKTCTMAKKLVQHGLAFGFDPAVGGVYDAGYYFKDQSTLTIIKNGKNWWTQAETLNTLLYMAKRYPKDPMDYYGKFQKQWAYMQQYLIDYTYGDLYAGGLDKEPHQKTSDKSHIWKGNYHVFRALMNCRALLVE